MIMPSLLTILKLFMSFGSGIRLDCPAVPSSVRFPEGLTSLPYCMTILCLLGYVQRVRHVLFGVATVRYLACDECGPSSHCMTGLIGLACVFVQTLKFKVFQKN